ncbi:MAG: tryptophan--tRNA ligase, partial [Candidatus Nanohaloarchaea archaeon]
RELVVEEYLKNYAALGIDLENVDFYFQSKAGNNHLARSKTFGRYLTQNEMENTYGNAEPGKIASALTQYADILRPQFPEKGGPKPTVVPVGVDQDPHIRITREVAAKYRDQDFIKPSSTYNKFMRGLQGGKMSSSDPKSFIALTDSVEEAKNKIDQAKTGGKDSKEKHRKEGADISEDMVFELLAFHLKQELEEFLHNHQEKRKEEAPKVEQYIEENFNFDINP